MKFNHLSLIFTFLLCVGSWQVVWGQFTAGNLLVLQVTGTTSSASPLSLLEFNTTTANQTLPVTTTSLPSTGATPITTSATATSEGQICLDFEQTHAIVPGYNAVTGTANIATSPSSGAGSFQRELYTVNPSQVATQAWSYNVFSGNNIRSGTAYGSTYYASGANTGIEMNGPLTVSSTVINTRVIHIYNGQLYFMTGTGTARGIWAVGSGIPTASSTSTSVVNTGSTGSGYGFSISPDSKTIYVADDTSGILKYVKTGASYILSTTVTPTGCRGLTVDYSTTPFTIYATTGNSPGNALLKILDNGTTYPTTTLATAPAGASFRGVTFVPASFAVIGGTATLCSGSRSNVFFYGNSGATVNYTVNGAAYELVLNNSGTDTLNSILTAGANDTVLTYSLVSVTTSLGTFPVVGRAVVTVEPSLPAPIAGVDSVCAGSSVPVTDVTVGGTWSCSNPLTATVGVGIITGVAAGTAMITYSLTNVCGVIAAMQSFAVNPMPDAGVITGLATICGGSMSTLSDSVGSGDWGSSNTSVAVVPAGELTGVAAGTAIITYSVTNSCGSAFATVSVLVNPLPTAGTVTGASSVCGGASVTLADTASGGAWRSNNTSVATVTSGVLTGVSAGEVVVSYSVSNVCGTATASQTVIVNPQPDAGTITGSTTLCTTSATVLSSTVGSGTWSSSNGSIATVADGTVTGVSEGTATITYAVTNSCGTAFARDTVVVNPQPRAGAITGPDTICWPGSVILTDPAPGGMWTSSNASVASISSGTVTGVSSGGAILTYTVTNLCGTALTTHTIVVSPPPGAGIISGPSTFCIGSPGALTDPAAGGIWGSSNIGVAIVSGGTVTPVAAGSAVISYTLSNGCGVATATRTIAVDPSPSSGSITGVSLLCAGAAVTLSDPIPGGTWSSSNTAVAIVAGGIVSGISAGSAVITYSVTVSCGTASSTKTITVYPLPQVSAILGVSSVCAGAAITLSDTSGGGTWRSDNTLVANIAGGNVIGVSAGTATITYTITNACGDAAATTQILVNPIPTAGIITGSTSVCAGLSVTLSAGIAGGTWSSNNIAIAAVSGGVVSGVVAGSALITYSVTNSCGSAIASHPITVVPQPDAGIISASASVCVGATVLVADSEPGGVWSSANAAVANVAGGRLTGVSVGTTTITYSVTNGCGTSVTAQLITVAPLPDAGVITGADSVCAASSIIFSDSAGGGVWSSSHTAVAAVSDGVVTGVSAGTAAISYSVTNGCGTATVHRSVTVSPLPDAGVITSSSASICQGGVILLSDTATGGIWSSSNPAASTISGGVVAGITAGTTLISYTTNNLCGTVAATFLITVAALPAVGALAGARSVCVGSTSLLIDTATGGSWSSNNTSVATVIRGLVAGIAPGTSTIIYMVSNTCGAAADTVIITVASLPVVDAISGASTVCARDTTALGDLIAGGTWSSSDATVATVDGGGLVTGQVAGRTTITYSVTNSCGSAIDTVVLMVLPLPNAGRITGPSQVCVADSIILIDSATGGAWSSANPAIAVIHGSVVVGVRAGVTMITYGVVNSCGSAIDTATITVNSLPSAGSISGRATLCPGNSVILSSTVTGGAWSATNDNAKIVSGVVTGQQTGADTIVYSVSDNCGTDTAQFIVNTISDSVVHIITHPEASLCANSLFQNFGASIGAQAGTVFSWTLSNGSIYALSANRQFCLVNFYDPGPDVVRLSVETLATGCTSTDSISAFTGTTVLPTPQVVYYSPMLVCLDNEASSYQWGYDDAVTLDSVILPGQVNQNYYNPNLDLLDRYYWVMTTYNGCTQKSYYNAPERVNLVQSPGGINFSIFPNPATGSIVNIRVDGQDDLKSAEASIYDMFGQQQARQPVSDNKATFDISTLAQGVYIIVLRLDGIWSGSGTFLK